MNKIRKADKRLSSLISRIGHNEAGFSMISAIMALMVGTLLSLAAWATANSDIAFTDKDKWARLAYQRAQSGVSDYVQHMAEDSGYWKSCDRPDGVTGDGLGQTAVNDNDIGATDHPSRRWLPWSSAGTTTDLAYHAQYTIDLEPTSGSCKPSATAADRMIDNSSGTFKIAVTGRAGPLVPGNLTGTAIEAWRQKNWKRVTIVAEFRRNGFLDYGYFTDHEGRDPKLLAASIQDVCNNYYQDNPGYDSTKPISETNRPGRWRNNANNSTTDCTEIQFADGDKLQGPFHTNDSVLLGSAPSSSSSALFGNANKGDRVEVYNNGKAANLCPVRTQDLNPPSVGASGCYTTLRTNSGASFIAGPAARFLDLPEDNDDLVLYADPDSGDPDSQGYTFHGKTKIVINTNNTITVTNDLVNAGAATTYNFPTSGVIYVDNYNVSSCPSTPYTSTYAASIPAGCALVEVQGTYNKSLTIGSESDIVITGDVQRGTSQTAVLGLIANQYVRVRHYRKSNSDKNYANASGTCGSDTATPVQTPISTIQAAILTLNNSFTVDGYQCGSYLGNLNFTGALAQRWRGTVGTGGCGSGTGYCKNYAYDYTFKSQTPPHFLAPTAATWKIIRLRQTLPACNCASNGT